MRFWIGVLAAMAVFSGPAQSDSPSNVVLLELFTSQGCASCPPADEVVGAFAQRDDVIALSLHVDYWDYIGWEDSFADAAFTSRQKQYARRWGRSTVYTPQIVIGGIDEAGSIRRSALNEVLAEHLAKPARVRLTLTRGAGGEIVIEASAEPQLDGEAEVLVLRYMPRVAVTVTSGENNGRRLTHYNVVTSLERVSTWDGQAALRMSVAAPGEDPAVVIVQEAGQGPVLAAGRRR